ncbi:hypothetical protein DAPPUDRAFT_279186, partial [Daphnia pulex]
KSVQDKLFLSAKMSSVKDYKPFCGEEQFWDANLTWTKVPEFSSCFRKTVFVCGPISVFWILLPFHLHSLYTSKKPAFPFSKLCL